MSEQDKSKRNEYYKTSDRSELATAESRAYEQEQPRHSRFLQTKMRLQGCFFCFKAKGVTRSITITTNFKITTCQRSKKML